ncbi:hypothetical protein GCM10023231_12760 [Olivibacter ginsenosidimutans]|uniref:Uncharacterized protein n=1 Tax=Olivibacter ginsenosidimutans TaxID=1176537 RepID=A0ABP9AUZ6_9SPHI
MKDVTAKVADYNAELVELFEVEELEERMEFAAWTLSAKGNNNSWEAGASVTFEV